MTPRRLRKRSKPVRAKLRNGKSIRQAGQGALAYPLHLFESAIPNFGRNLLPDMQDGSPPMSLASMRNFPLPLEGGRVSPNPLQAKTRPSSRSEYPISTDAGIALVRCAHVRLRQGAWSGCSPAGLILFSDKFCRFKLDAATFSGAIKNIGALTIPFDFEREKRIHQAWELLRE